MPTAKSLCRASSDAWKPFIWTAKSSALKSFDMLLAATMLIDLYLGRELSQCGVVRQNRLAAEGSKLNPSGYRGVML